MAMESLNQFKRFSYLEVVTSNLLEHYGLESSLECTCSISTVVRVVNLYVPAKLSVASFRVLFPRDFLNRASSSKVVLKLLLYMLRTPQNVSNSTNEHS